MNQTTEKLNTRNVRDISIEDLYHAWQHLAPDKVTIDIHTPEDYQ